MSPQFITINIRCQPTTQATLVAAKHIPISACLSINRDLSLCLGVHVLRYQFKAIFILIKNDNNLEVYLSITRKTDKITKMSILKLPKVHQLSEMVIVQQH